MFISSDKFMKNMYRSKTVLLIFLLWFELVQNQWWNGYSVGACVDSYPQSYTSTYTQPGYDYAQYLQLSYLNPYSQPNIYDYQQYSYNPYQESAQSPIVIIINDNDRDEGWELYDIISLITSLKDKKDDEPIYIPYPVPISCGCDNDYDWGCDGYSDCGCRNTGNCNSCKKSEKYRDDDCECRKKGRSKSKCRCSNSRSNCDRDRCNKCDPIKHKSDYCCRG